MPSGTSRSSPSTAVIGPNVFTTPRSSIAAMAPCLHGRSLGLVAATERLLGVLDERWIRALHVETMRTADLHAEREHHVLFQASTIGALLDGAYEGDLTFAELAEHGDLGLGTLNGLDGEMIALDGRFWRADVEGEVSEIEPTALTPFAVVTRLRAVDRHPSSAGRSTTPSCWRGLDELIPAEAASCAIRLDGRFELGPRPIGAPPEPALPAVDRGRPRTERLRADRGRGDDARLPLPRLRRGHRGRRLAPPLRLRRPQPRRPRPRLPLATACAPDSTPRASCTSSCRPGSTSPTPTSPRRPTPRSTRSSALSEALGPGPIDPANCFLRSQQRR